MIVQQLLELAANYSGISDGNTLYDFINQAAQELWNSEDFPGTLQEESFKPYDSGEAFVSLPYYVQAIRGVRPCIGMTTDVMHKVTAVMDDQYVYSPWRWRQVKRSPLIRNLGEASQLTIKRRLPAATEEVIVTLGGPSDVAESAEETVLFTADASEKQTVNAYEDLTHICKDVITTCDLEFYDSEGNLVAVLPNNFLEVFNTIIQITATCSQRTACCNNCVLVLFKPYLPPLLRETDHIPEFMEQSLYFKFKEWLDLHSADKLERAGIMAVKSTALHERAALIAERGQQRPLNVRRSPFISYAGYRL